MALKSTRKIAATLLLAYSALMGFTQSKLSIISPSSLQAKFYGKVYDSKKLFRGINQGKLC